MIITKTPLRISFFSGGSDMPAFFNQEAGAALSATIDKCIYIAVHKTQHIGIKTMYDEVSQVEDVSDMQHSITRETLKLVGIDKEITIASISDIIAKGSGLGSSSAFTTGLIHALASLQETADLLTPELLAQTAYNIERNLCGYPVGKQDQYAAAYGGMNLFEFNTNDTVNVKSFAYQQHNIDKLQDNLLLVYSGKSRSANSILQKQAAAMLDLNKFKMVKRSRDKAYTAAGYITDGKIDDFGALLHDAWMDKKGVVGEISQYYFDFVYSKAIDAGALGGKLLGAGGGGFFVFYVTPDKREEVIKAVTTETECKVYDFKFTNYGSRLLSNC